MSFRRKIRRLSAHTVHPLVARLRQRIAALEATRRDSSLHPLDDLYYQAILDHAPLGVYLSLPNHIGRPSYASSYVYHLLGYTPDEVELDNLTWPDIIHPDDHASIVNSIERLISNGASVVEYRLIDRQGQAHWIYDQSLLINHQGILQAIRFIIDVTARHEAEEQLRLLNAELDQRIQQRTERLEWTIAQLREQILHRRQIEEQLTRTYTELQQSYNLLHGVLNSLEDGVALINADGSLLTANQSFERLSTPETVASLLMPLVRQTGTTGSPQRLRERVIRQDGSTALVDIRIVPLPGTGTFVDRILVQLVDLTEQAQLEAQALDRERFAANARLAATVAHEINTPLQAIESCLHLVRTNSVEQHEVYLDLAREEIHRISAILR